MPGREILLERNSKTDRKPCFCTWSAKDLTNELFFNFPDVKPGDEGEDTVSIHVDNNDAWVCAELANLKNNDNGCDSPENKPGVDNLRNQLRQSGEGQGELKDNLYFTIWKDTDCDNILDMEVPGDSGNTGILRRSHDEHSVCRNT